MAVYYIQGRFSGIFGHFNTAAATYTVSTKNYTPVYVVITVVNNVGFKRNSTPTMRS